MEDLALEVNKTSTSRARGIRIDNLRRFTDTLDDQKLSSAKACEERYKEAFQDGAELLTANRFLDISLETFPTQLPREIIFPQTIAT